MKRPREQFFATLCDLVRIPSCSDARGGDEGAVQAYVARRLRAAGARVTTFEALDVPAFFDHPVCCGPDRDYSGRPTVLGEVGPDDAPALLVLAHADTVSINNEPEHWTAGPFEPVMRDGCLYGRGSGDDKWGVAAVLTLAERLQEGDAACNRRVVFASTIDEENGVGNGLLLLHLFGVRAEAALYLDGCNAAAIVGTLGGSTVTLSPAREVTGEAFSLHAARLEAACRRMCATRSSVFDRPLWRDNYMREYSVGFRANAVADERRLAVPFYTLPGEDPEFIRHEVEVMIRGALGRDYGSYALHCRAPWFEPSTQDPDVPLVGFVCEAIREQLEIEPRILTGAKQDSFVLREYAGIPTVSFGISRLNVPGGAHEPDEHIECDIAWRGFRAAEQAVRAWLAA